MAVRAKFQCSSVVPTPSDSPAYTCKTVHLHAVYGDGKANESWSKATPNGSLSMTITNPDALSQFVPGKEYFLDFTPADEAA